MAKRAKDCIACEFYKWNLYRRADGVWYADGRGNRPSLGKHSLGTHDRATAVETLKELDRVKAVEQGRAAPMVIRADSCWSITEGWDQYRAYCERPAVMGGINPDSVKRYKAVRDKHEAFCAKHGLETWRQVTKSHVQEYGSWLRKNEYSDSTLYLEITLLKQVVKWMIEKGVLPDAARIHVRLTRSEESDRYCYKRDEVQAMVDHCCATPALAWFGEIIIALATTGMRIGELVQLRWSDVDLKQGTITVKDNRHSHQARQAGTLRTTKGKRSRRIPIHPELRLQLVKRSEGAEGHVFLNPCGKPLRPDKVLLVFKKKVRAALINRFPTAVGEIGYADGTLHSFRHYFVSQAFLGGAFEGEIREWVGHRDSRIVERYRHLQNDDAQRKMSQLHFLNARAANEKPAIGA